MKNRTPYVKPPEFKVKPLVAAYHEARAEQAREKRAADRLILRKQLTERVKAGTVSDGAAALALAVGTAQKEQK